jgi:hypothetical protein
MGDVPTKDWVFRYECIGLPFATPRVKGCKWVKSYRGMMTGPSNCPECGKQTGSQRSDRRVDLSRFGL